MNDEYSDFVLLGEGVNSFVYSIYHLRLNKRVALKFTNYRDDNEIISLSTIQDSSYNHLFQNIIEYHIVQDIIGPYTLKEHSERYLVIISDIYISTVQDIDKLYPYETIVSIVLEIIISVIELHRLGIYHNDLHFNNIMLRKNKNKRCYEINDIVYYVTSIYQPVLIDFGKSTREEIKIDETYITKYEGQYPVGDCIDLSHITRYLLSSFYPTDIIDEFIELRDGNIDCLFSEIFEEFL